jgi:hypothetical protein
MTTGSTHRVAYAARVAVLSFFALLLALPAWARPLPDSNTWPHEQSDLPPDPAVVWGKLDNGMRYVLLPNDTPKGRLSLRLLVATGSLMEAEHAPATRAPCSSSSCRPTSPRSWTKASRSCARPQIIC